MASIAAALTSIVHQPTVLLHNVYLGGLLIVAAAGVTERRRTVLRIAGVALAAAGVAAQYAVSPA